MDVFVGRMCVAYHNHYNVLPNSISGIMGVFTIK